MTCGGTTPDCYALIDGQTWVKQEATFSNPRYTGQISQSPLGLLASGGQTDSGTTQVYEGGQWTPGPPLPYTIWGHCQVFSGQEVLIAGGNTNQGYKSNKAYTLEGEEWIKIPDMKHGRFGPSCAVLDNMFYVIGGGVTSVEVFDLELRKWSEGPSLPHQKNLGQAVVYGNKLYAFDRGGSRNKIHMLSEDKTSWVDVGTFDVGVNREAYPAPLVTAEMLNC